MNVVQSIFEQEKPVRLFCQPGHGVYYKWWTVELRFSRPLTRRQYRGLDTLSAPWRSGIVGRDGGYWSRWWNSYPDKADSDLIIRTAARTGIPAKVRAAPLGRDCPGDQSCPCADPEEPNHRCMLGSTYSPSPVFVPSDWINIAGYGEGM
jgi:hypothetical protein